MKIVTINNVYGTGSTGKIVKEIHDELLKHNIDSYVFFGRGKKSKEKNVFKMSSEFNSYIHSICSRLTGDEYSFSFIPTIKLIRKLKKIKPDIVQLHCLNSHFINIYLLMRYLKKNNIKTYLTLHAEIMHTSFCEHVFDCNKWKENGCYKCNKKKGFITKYFRDDSKAIFNKLKKAFSNYDNITVIGVSDYMSRRARESVIFRNSNIITIKNGIDTSKFKRQYDLDLKKKILGNYSKLIIHVTPSFESKIKGGNYLLDIAKKMPDYLFLVVGNHKRKNIDNVVFYGRTENKKELAKLYSIADCFACTSLCESYPTVCLEASSCGCKIVSFNVGGIPETIPLGYGVSVEPYNIDMFVEKLKEWCNKPQKEGYSVKNDKEFCEDYLSAYLNE